MSLIRAVEYKAVAYFLVKILKEGKIKEIAAQVGTQIDNVLDQRYKEKRSEELQAKLIRIINQFTNSLIAKLKENWSTKGDK